MTNSKKLAKSLLLLRPRPFASESLAGYQLRLAESNGYRSGIWLLRQLLGTRRTSSGTTTQTNELASFLELDSEEMSRLAYLYENSPWRSQIHYFGQIVNRKHLRSNTPAICPTCLKERAATNGFWELRYAVACPFHETLLIDLCQGCGQPVTWHRSKVSECPKCSFDYRNSAVEIAAEEVLEITKLIYSTANISLIDVPARSTYQGMPIAALQSESLDALLWMFRCTARSLIFEPSSPSAQLMHSYSDCLLHEHGAVLATAYILREWPDRILERVYQLSSHSMGVSSTKSSQLLISLARPFMPQLFQQVAHAFIESSLLLYGERARVSEQTYKQASLIIGTCSC